MNMELAREALRPTAPPLTFAFLLGANLRLTKKSRLKSYRVNLGTAPFRFCWRLHQVSVQEVRGRVGGQRLGRGEALPAVCAFSPRVTRRLSPSITESQGRRLATGCAYLTSCKFRARSD
jgi:hypothetical protein